MASSPKLTGKRTKGRQKIEMKRIENEEDRLVAFSKRKAGIIKKANELVTLTGAEVFFITFSPGGKPYSFVHPSIESITNCFLNVNRKPSTRIDGIIQIIEKAQRQSKINGLTQQYNDLVNQLDIEKEKAKELDRFEGKDFQGWWNVPIEDMNLEQLLQVNTSFSNLHSMLHAKIEEKNNEAPSSSNSFINLLLSPINDLPSSSNGRLMD